MTLQSQHIGPSLPTSKLRLHERKETSIFFKPPLSQSSVANSGTEFLMPYMPSRMPRACWLDVSPFAKEKLVLQMYTPTSCKFS